MSINLTPIANLLFRIIFLGAGLVALALSFFHGFDLNLLFLVGILIIVVGVSPYEIHNKMYKAIGIFTLTITIGLYLYLLTIMLQVTSPNVPVEISDVVLLLPLVCMTYLLVYIFKNNPGCGKGS
jgi:hypothetical protein